ncbi:MAG: competence/damage-inducible protein A [Azospirillum sp.]|nr:competence/damage-inducible protein A [Azospirillum sp.]
MDSKSGSSGGRVVTACVLVIGNEILSGRTQDVNLSYLARKLAALGVRLREARVIADDEAAIVAAVNQCRTCYDYVFTTGGIGPTHDDITSAAVAKAFGVALERHAEAERRLVAHYRGGTLNAARLRMAELPVGATLIDNPVSMAPGFRLDNVLVLAGVPRIMQAMFESVAPNLTGGAVQHALTVSCELAEGELAAALTALQGRWPDLEIGSYPYFRRGYFGVSLVLRGTDTARLDQAAATLCDIVRGMGGHPTLTGADGDHSGGEKADGTSGETRRVLGDEDATP